MRCDSRLMVLCVPMLAGSCWMADAASAQVQTDALSQQAANVPAEPSILGAEKGSFKLNPLMKRDKAGDPLFSLDADEIGFRTLLEGIANQTGRRIIMADKVPNTPISARLENLTIPDLIRTLCNTRNLAYLTTNSDYILVVPFTKGPFTLDIRPRQDNRPRSEVRPPAKFSHTPPFPQASDRSHWTPFQFNGQTYYAVPVQKDGTGRASMEAPEAQGKAGIVERLKATQFPNKLPLETRPLLQSPTPAPSR